MYINICVLYVCICILYIILTISLFYMHSHMHAHASLVDRSICKMPCLCQPAFQTGAIETNDIIKTSLFLPKATLCTWLPAELFILLGISES